MADDNRSRRRKTFVHNGGSDVVTILPADDGDVETVTLIPSGRTVEEAIQISVTAVAEGGIAWSASGDFASRQSHEHFSRVLAFALERRFSGGSAIGFVLLQYCARITMSMVADGVLKLRTDGWHFDTLLVEERLREMDTPS